jgi:DNA helicase-2/ATP-dependent DNA helicase PcrA
MEKETAHLEYIIQQIKDRLTTIEATIAAGDKEVENMHTYYWENYTEMDEYGYENFDNQQQLLSQVNANENQRVLRSRLRKMLDSPYFARVDFCYENEEEPEQYYIGIGSFSTKAGSVPLIFDWRAPVSGLFYDYDKGPASFEAPAGTIKGEITSKWQYKIKDSKLVYAFESDVKIDDDILKEELGGNGDVKLKNIVRTIQKEQNQIIRNTQDKIMIVQGVAGSGKTSIALHRIAYLLYRDRQNLKASDVLVLTPNGVFTDYISHILPELGEENVAEMSFDLFAYRQLKQIVPDCEDKYDAIEAMLEQGDTYGDRLRYKGSRAFAEAINAYVLNLESELVNFKDIAYKKLFISADQIRTLFYEKFTETPLLSRMKMVMDYAVDEVETLTGRTFDEQDLYFIEEAFTKLYITTDLYRIYSNFLKSQGMKRLPKVPYEQRKLPYEDVFPMLYMKYQLESVKKGRPVRHLVVDEMQDYSYIQYLIVAKLFSCKMTIVGDLAQTIDSRQQDVMTFLPHIFGRKLPMLSMKRSYRNTMEIGQYAKAIIQDTQTELLERHGEPVEEAAFTSFAQAVEHICRKMGDYETIAIICVSQAEAALTYELLCSKIAKEEIHYMDKNSSRFYKGITVTTFYLAKGREFDQVFALYEKMPDSPLRKQARYICATRALHALSMYEIELDK